MRSVWLQTLLGPVVSTLLFLIIFVAVFRRNPDYLTAISFVEFIAPGLILMAVMQNAFANTSSSLLIGKVSRTFVDVLMAPLRPSELVAAYAAAAATRGIVVGAAVWALILPFGAVAPNNWALTVLFAVGAALVFALLGLVTGIFATRMEHVAAASGLIIAPLTMLAGTFYSVSLLPDPVRLASFFQSGILFDRRLSLRGHRPHRSRTGANGCGDDRSGGTIYRRLYSDGRGGIPTEGLTRQCPAL